MRIKARHRQLSLTDVTRLPLCPPPMLDAPMPSGGSFDAKNIKVAELCENITALIGIAKYQVVTEI